MPLVPSIEPDLHAQKAETHQLAMMINILLEKRMSARLADNVEDCSFGVQEHLEQTACHQAPLARHIGSKV